MRSLLFIPADDEKKLAKGLGSRRRCADPRPGGLRERGAQGGGARPRRGSTSRRPAARERRPLLYVRINALDTPHWEDDLAGVMGSRPDGILLPKARSGEDVHTLSIALHHAEERAGTPKGGDPHHRPDRREVPISLLQLQTYVGASSRLEALTWGAEDLSARYRRAQPTARTTGARGRSPYRLARDLCLFTAAAAEAAADRHGVRQLPRRGGPARRGARGRARRLHGQDGHPPQPGRRHQRGVHARARGDRALAEEIVQAFAANPEAGVLGIRGQMVDKAHVARAERILARAKAAQG